MIPPTKRSTRPRTQPSWMRDVKVGDVLRVPSGDMRVVREMTKYLNGDLGTISMVTRRCSWTGRGFTTVNYIDMIQRGFEPTGVNVPLDGKFEERLFSDQRKRRKKDEYLVSCCDVKGIP